MTKYRYVGDYPITIFGRPYSPGDEVSLKSSEAEDPEAAGLIEDGKLLDIRAASKEQPQEEEKEG